MEHITNWYFWGVYFTFIKTGSNGFWSPSGIALSNGTDDFHGGVIFGSNATDVYFMVYAVECTFDITGLAVQPND